MNASTTAGRAPRATRAPLDDEGVRSFEASGGDWDEIAAEAAELGEERIVVNMGPQHPSTHGVLRLVLDLEGETVTKARVVIGYLHTGIEKNCEYRSWTQGTTFVTRMDYLAPLFNETAYCLAVEKLLGIEAPPRAQTIRVLVMELNRIASHLVGLATGAMELGALTGMTNGFREREMVLDLLEEITGLRMNHAYIRPGGLAQDLPEGAVEHIREFLAIMPSRVADFHKMLTGRAELAGLRHSMDQLTQGLAQMLDTQVTHTQMLIAVLGATTAETEPEEKLIDALGAILAHLTQQHRQMRSIEEVVRTLPADLAATLGEQLTSALAAVK